jgi:hypothetical protein
MDLGNPLREALLAAFILDSLAVAPERTFESLYAEVSKTVSREEFGVVLQWLVEDGYLKERF